MLCQAVEGEFACLLAHEGQATARRLTCHCHMLLLLNECLIGGMPLQAVTAGLGRANAECQPLKCHA